MRTGGAAKLLHVLLICSAFFGFVTSRSAYAVSDYDFTYGLLGRSRILPVLAFADIGYSTLIWGDYISKEEISKTGAFPLYGYTRASVYGESALVANGIHPRFDFFPLPIIGFSAGYEAYQHSFRPHSYRTFCSEVGTCTGLTQRTFYMTILRLGYGPFRGTTTYARGKLWNGGDKPFFHFPSGLILKNGGGTMTTASTLFLGYKVDSQMTLGYYRLRDTAEDPDRENFTGLDAAAMIYRFNGFSIGLGVGRYISTSALYSDSLTETSPGIFAIFRQDAKLPSFGF